MVSIAAVLDFQSSAAAISCIRSARPFSTAAASSIMSFTDSTEFSGIVTPFISRSICFATRSTSRPEIMSQALRFDATRDAAEPVAGANELGIWSVPSGISTQPHPVHPQFLQYPLIAQLFRYTYSASHHSRDAKPRGTLGVA